MVHSWDLTRMCLNKTGQGMFSNVFEMYCHHLKIRFHIKFRFLACMTTWSCCAPLLSFPRCPLTRSTCPPHSTDLHCQQEHSRPAALCACPAPSHSSPLKICSDLGMAPRVFCLQLELSTRVPSVVPPLI